MFYYTNCLQLGGIKNCVSCPFGRVDVPVAGPDGADLGEGGLGEGLDEEVLGDPLDPARPHQRDGAPHDGPAEEDLGGRQALVLGHGQNLSAAQQQLDRSRKASGYSLVLEQAGGAARAQRGVGLGDDPVLPAKLHQRILRQVRVQLDLVDLGDNPSLVDQALHPPSCKVGDPDGPDPPALLEPLGASTGE